VAVDSNGDEITTFLDPLILRAQACVGQALDGKWRLEVLRGVGGMAAGTATSSWTSKPGSRDGHPEQTS
jgi:subtilisin-like proprotein convertase family protein